MPLHTLRSSVGLERTAVTSASHPVETVRSVVRVSPYKFASVSSNIRSPTRRRFAFSTLARTFGQMKMTFFFIKLDYSKCQSQNARFNATGKFPGLLVHPLATSHFCTSKKADHFKNIGFDEPNNAPYSRFECPFATRPFNEI
jgi:hypothetical protein